MPGVAADFAIHDHFAPDINLDDELDAFKAVGALHLERIVHNGDSVASARSEGPLGPKTSPAFPLQI